MSDPRPANNSKVEEIFAATHHLPREQRRAEVVRLCAGDATLEAECLRLLEAADAASLAGAFEQKPLDLLGTTPVEASGPRAASAPPRPAAPQAAVPTQPMDAAAARPIPVGLDRATKAPEAIGPYRILSVLGEGGFGVVYAAERREPIRQRVALKLIKPGMDSRAVIARFEQERQALAVMNHTNIAKVLDAGVTDEALGSRPYFVMEHVPGEPITDYCDRHNLTLRQRLELFIPVCEAVQHAHHKGIIHRDLKPSNILVAVVDGKPIPKVIDFGVAKATAKTFTDATIFTEQGQLIGTPEYMSPEQAEMGATDIDTRSDVYSLGAVLYELLTGAVPFDSRSLRAAALIEIQRIIREVEPPKPSTRLTSLAGDAVAAIAKRRQMDREALASELRRELDWIPLQALRKDRTERYATPSDLAEDIRNYMEGKPLDAGPESTGYRLRKFVRRNRGAVLTGAVLTLTLTAGLIATGLAAAWAIVEADKARRAEAEQRRLAEENAGLAQAKAALAASEAEQARIATERLATLQLEQARSALWALSQRMQDWPSPFSDERYPVLLVEDIRRVSALASQAAPADPLITRQVAAHVALGLADPRFGRLGTPAIIELAQAQASVLADERDGGRPIALLTGESLDPRAIRAAVLSRLLGFRGPFFEGAAANGLVGGRLTIARAADSYMEDLSLLLVDSTGYDVPSSVGRVRIDPLEVSIARRMLAIESDRERVDLATLVDDLAEVMNRESHGTGVLSFGAPEQLLLALAARFIGRLQYADAWMCLAALPSTPHENGLTTAEDRLPLVLRAILAEKLGQRDVASELLLDATQPVTSTFLEDSTFQMMNHLLCQVAEPSSEVHCWLARWVVGSLVDNPDRYLVMLPATARIWFGQLECGLDASVLDQLFGDPDQVESLWERARNRARDDPTTAAVLYSSALDALESIEPQPGVTQELLKVSRRAEIARELASLLLDSGRFDDAVDVMQSCLRLADPSSKDLASLSEGLMLGMAHLGGGRREQGEFWVRRVFDAGVMLEARPRRAVLLAECAIALCSSGAGPGAANQTELAMAALIDASEKAQASESYGSYLDVLIARLATVADSPQWLAEGERAARRAIGTRVELADMRIIETWSLENAHCALGALLTRRARDSIEGGRSQECVETLKEAERHLLPSAEALFVGEGVPRARRREAVERVCALYALWDEVAPGASFSERATEWRERLKQLLPTESDP